MDSLTQIVLGAACGELAAGKKIGNRALLWGAIGGTIPDLDVLSNFFMEPLDALAFHRGPTHSLLFNILVPLLLAWLVSQLYRTSMIHQKWYKITAISLGSIFVLAISGFFNFILHFLLKEYSWPIIAIVIIGLIFWLTRLGKQILNETDTDIPRMNYFSWYVLFLLSMVTHPLLDNFTTFGTQLFWPFSHHRFTLSNISIVDPIYTLPFLGTVIACSLLDRNSQKRKILNWAGLVWSSLYLCLTFINKNAVDRLFEKSLSAQKIPVEKYLTSPMILNNALWYCIAKSNDLYYYGYYSLFDQQDTLIPLKVTVKNQFQWPIQPGEKNLQTLSWFSDNYYNIIPLQNDTIQFNDLRYGNFKFSYDNKNDYGFHFKLLSQGNGNYKMLNDSPRPNITDEDLNNYWLRILGRIQNQ